ncbi:mitochondrial translational release factor [Emiliania huxleyi CCMP1516]|uniref:Prokaryotic-type class I peptide chain release factors domain-containing protein n=2 Tax=Emiliania huxleyi TaxID=2903 RepID=A0A0D3IRE8_EMIH1|nr:mitochondrial translational release factor [Emiliania huxleyi CCMP1516]EOD13833.1 mitochondrial translational release factor [Emiliania huxleyi CCMP1516]|eukprot:XP_005766262.1 mitochondrial translational release factor [Emiliania huxleyi CCMP1516]
MSSGDFSVARAREVARLAPIADAHARVQEGAAEVRGLRELADDASSEAELRELARAELEEAEAALGVQQESLVALLVPVDDEEEAAAGRGALVELHPGVGGNEAATSAEELLRMYERYCKRKGWRFSLLSHSAFEYGGCREASASVTGEGVFSALRSESGTHRVQRIPETESQGRVHTSTAVVAVMPEYEAAEVPELTEARRRRVMRAGGAGGQHVNTTESAVRLTHTPTGIKAFSQNERSQHSNRATAMKMLAARVKAHEEEKRRAEQQAARGAPASGGRSERVRTYNFADDRVTDHRINCSKFGLAGMFAGELIDEFGAELAAARAEERLQSLLAELEQPG